MQTSKTKYFVYIAPSEEALTDLMGGRGATWYTTDKEVAEKVFEACAEKGICVTMREIVSTVTDEWTTAEEKEE